MREISLQKAVSEVVGSLRPRAEKEGITLTAEVPRDLPAVLGDPESMEQLITNLVANAVKYTPKDGQVSIGAALEGNHIVLRVADTGIGIQSEDLQHVFDEFYRGENARRFAEEGTGLGLSIVKSIADMQKAKISIQTEVGRGTTFEVALPLANA
jgi:signal transduction histidine kinase